MVVWLGARTASYMECSRSKAMHAETDQPQLLVLLWRRLLAVNVFTLYRSFIPHICHGLTDGVRGEKNLSCGEISNFCTWQMLRNLKFFHKWINFTFYHMTDVEKSEISFIMCTIYGILLHFTLFCCKKFSFLGFMMFFAKSVCCNLRAIVWRKF